MTFVGKNAELYVPKFERFNVGGVPDYSVTWHWPAFLVPVWWFLYRKMYFGALVAFLADAVLFPISRIVLAMTANYWYFRHSTQKIRDVRDTRPADVTGALRQLGGVNTWVIPLAVILTFIVTAIIFMAVLAWALAVARMQ